MVVAEPLKVVKERGNWLLFFQWNDKVIYIERENTFVMYCWTLLVMEVEYLLNMYTYERNTKTETCNYETLVNI